jgi:hypothetical protein
MMSRWGRLGGHLDDGGGRWNGSAGRSAMDRLTTTERFSLWLFAAVLGLGLGAILHAGALGSIGLVALVGIVLGVGLAATARSR